MNRYCIKIVILLLPLIALGYCEQSVGNSYVNKLNNISENRNQSKYSTTTTTTTNQQHGIKNSQHFVSDMQEFSKTISEYVDDILKRDTINLLPGIAIQKKINTSDVAERRTADKSLISKIQQFTNNHVLTVNLARVSTETGRLFFFKGKKFLGGLVIVVHKSFHLFLWAYGMICKALNLLYKIAMRENFWIFIRILNVN